MIRFLSVVLAVAAALAGSLLAFHAIQAVGPENRTGALEVPGGGRPPITGLSNLLGSYN
jgi:hypothetical protein